MALIWMLLFQACATTRYKSYDAYIQHYKESFDKDPRAPLKGKELDSMAFYPFSKEWSLKKCECEILKKPIPFEMATYSGVTRTYITYAIAKCKTSKNRTLQLSIYKNIQQPINPLYKDHLFLPYKDATNGEITYGGGRYINLNINDIKNGKIDIDFNTSYNPWCAYSQGYNCPIPPVENHFDFEVNAGEKKYLGRYKSK